MMASAVRKTFSEAGTRLPSSDSTPSAKAMSVAVGIAQPRQCGRIVAVDRDIDQRRHDHAAGGGDAGQARAAARSTSWPSSISRLISSPTSRKNTAISPSLTQCETLSGPR